MIGQTRRRIRTNVSAQLAFEAMMVSIVTRREDPVNRELPHRALVLLCAAALSLSACSSGGAGSSDAARQRRPRGRGRHGSCADAVLTRRPAVGASAEPPSEFPGAWSAPRHGTVDYARPDAGDAAGGRWRG
ncbi:hypothetical protein QJS66_09630 [Kocuria rhizophila]|nr:hypothetical protein QJS66_09630 [Kocuria rhizophila]